MKNVLIINGHPDPESYNHGLAEAYQEGAGTTEAQVEILHLHQLTFDPILRYGYRQRTELEPDLRRAIELIQAADHLVWVFPMWWFGAPALIKVFIDRIFLPGIMFEYVEGKSFPKKLLKGKTGRMIVTADTPRWYDRWFMGRPAIRQFKKGTLEFCGVSPVKVTYIATIKGSTDAFRQQWLQRVNQLGKALR